MTFVRKILPIHQQIIFLFVAGFLITLIGAMSEQGVWRTFYAFVSAPPGLVPGCTNYAYGEIF